MECIVITTEYSVMVMECANRDTILRRKRLDYMNGAKEHSVNAMEHA